MNPGSQPANGPAPSTGSSPAKRQKAVGDPAIARRLPHQRPALYVEAVLRRIPEQLVCRGRLPLSLAATTGLGAGEQPTACAQRQTSALMALELAAQACALWDPVGDGERPPSTALLVSIRSATLRDGVPVGVPLEVNISRLGGAGGLRKFTCTVCLEGSSEVLVEAEIGTFVRP